MFSWYINLEQGPLEHKEVLASLKSNFEINSTSHYRESTTF